MDASQNGKDTSTNSVLNEGDNKKELQNSKSAPKKAKNKPTVNRASAKKADSKKVNSKSSSAASSSKKPIAKNSGSNKSVNVPIQEKGQGNSPYPRHSLDKCFRIPKAVLDQNAGRECTEDEAARFLGLNGSNGMFRVEVSSATKYGLIERPNPKNLKPTDLAKKIIRPQSPEDETVGLRECIESPSNQ